MYGTRQAVVAEIAGHAPAGGTIFSICCDSRVAAPGVMVGLNEAAFGLAVPTFVNYIMQDLVGIRVANRLMGMGTLLKSEQALKIGLVDEVVDTSAAEGGAGGAAAVGEAVKEAAVKECEMWISAPGRADNKYWQRKNRLDQFYREREIDKKAFLDIVTAPITQQRLGAYLASLSKKTK